MQTLTTEIKKCPAKRPVEQQSHDRWSGEATSPGTVIPLRTVQTKRPYLLVLSGAHSGEVFELDQPTIWIGRDETLDVCFRDGRVSRVHAKITRLPTGDCRIEDLSSTNGTHVNGRLIKEALLQQGDLVQLGGTSFAFEKYSRAEGRVLTTLYDTATRDALTGVFNRHYLQQHLGAGFHLATRHDEPLSVLFVDVDHFKEINDTHGHAVGDSVLLALARRMSGRLRAEDILARYGGEEFVLVLPRTALGGAVAVAESLRSMANAAAFSCRGAELRVAVSIGVACLSAPGEYASALDLLAAADAALYRAKQGGRDRIEVAPPGRELDDPSALLTKASALLEDGLLAGMAHFQARPNANTLSPWLEEA